MSSRLFTRTALDAVRWERAPRNPGSRVNRRIVCRDGYAVSVQASPDHYANDDSDGEAPYWKGPDPEVAYPFVTVEVGNPTADPEPAAAWEQYESGGVWAWVPIGLVECLLLAHGGAVMWEHDARERSEP